MEPGWFVAPIMAKIIDTGFQYLKVQYRWQTGMKKELQRLQDLYPKIKAVVFASRQAQLREQNPDLNQWLWQLRDAIDEADDVLDEFEYMNHKRQVTKSKKQIKVRAIMKSIKKRLVKSVKRALQIDPNLKRLEEVVKKLDEVSANVGNFLYLLEITKQEQQEQLQEFFQTRETGSLPKNDLIGRDKDKEFVMQWLKKRSNKDDTTFYSKISLLSIVGHGGMGKTTLLQHVYNETKEFELKIWVCVSTNFDAKKVIADMLEYLKKKRPLVESLGTLQESLKSEVLSKKFLLVLDDIWGEEDEEDKSKWENVLAPLAYGSSGSKILITTRMYLVASMIAKLMIKKEDDTILRLEGLEEDKCLQLLNSYAFGNAEHSDDHKHLSSIAGQIVKKLSGSPLAAKVIGGVLNSSLDKRHWLNILNSDIASAAPGQNGLWSILRLSYIFLPKHLQNCFAFCCIFPQHHIIYKDDLVRIWIALGFIQSSYNQEETAEDIGDALEDWFDATITDDCLFPCLTELYLSDCSNLKELPCLPPMLKLLKMVNIGWKTLSCRSISKSIPLEQLSILRCPNITSIPLEIARFAALRYLEIAYCPNPISLGGHQEVETTENCQLTLNYLHNCHPSMLLMEPLRSITSLQQLCISDNDELVSFPSEVEQWFLHVSSSLCELWFVRLKSLRFLPSSLESLSSLKILHIDDVPQLQLLPIFPASLEELHIEELESLQCLTSSFSTIYSLKRLRINKVPLLQLLSNFPASLEELILEELRSLQCLPSSLLTISSLKRLEIGKVPMLQQLPDLPSSLEYLVIYGCHEELIERYNEISGFERDKLAHIPYVSIF